MAGRVLLSGQCECECDNLAMDILLVSLASLLAGCIDAIVGGGGLILVPTLLATFPTTHPATLFGTNKAASVWGTSLAAVQYSLRVRLRWRALAPAALAGFVAALGGAWMVTQVSSHFLRQLLPFVMLGVLLYTLHKKELGRAHAPLYHGLQETLRLCAIGAVIGGYDGFFGPGTGSFFVFAMVRMLGYDFLHASAAAKLLNVATNLAALLLFSLQGAIWWHFALPMALANVLGSWAGSHLALKHGTGFVRGVFIVVVGALILKTGYDAFVR